MNVWNAFFVVCTPAFISATRLPDLASAEQIALPAAVHLGTLATVVEPGASVLLDWASPTPATAWRQGRTRRREAYAGRCKHPPFRKHRVASGFFFARLWSLDCVGKEHGRYGGSAGLVSRKRDT